MKRTSEELAVRAGGMQSSVGAVAFVAGIDLGQREDYTAVSVVKIVEVAPGEPASYDLVHLGQVIGMEYPAQIEMFDALLRNPPLAGRTLTVVDASGPGRPVSNEMRKRISPLLAVTLTAGRTVGGEPGDVTVPKPDVIGVLTVLLQTVDREGKRRLRIPRSKAVNDVYDALNRQLKAFEGGSQPEHDDLVLALALSCWGAEHRPKHRPAAASVGNQYLGGRKPTMAVSGQASPSGWTETGDPGILIRRR